MKINHYLLAGIAATLFGLLGCGGQSTFSQQQLAGSSLTPSGSGSTSGNSGTTTSSNSGPTPPAQAKKFQSVQTASNWSSCHAADCAGGSGAGEYWIAQNQAAPSLSGRSMELHNSGIWANALWWNKLGARPDDSNFVWDFDFLLDDASLTAAQALEFDLFQFRDGYNYMMGSECNYASGVWDLWNEATGRWQPTSTPCPKFQPGVWHHIQWYGQRTPGTTTYTFVSLTVDGTTYSLNQSFSAKNVGWDGQVGVQFQLDVNASGQAYEEWVDNVTVTTW